MIKKNCDAKISLIAQEEGKRQMWGLGLFYNWLRKIRCKIKIPLRLMRKEGNTRLRLIWGWWEKRQCGSRLMKRKAHEVKIHLNLIGKGGGAFVEWGQIERLYKAFEIKEMLRHWASLLTISIILGMLCGCNWLSFYSSHCCNS